MPATSFPNARSLSVFSNPVTAVVVIGSWWMFHWTTLDCCLAWETNPQSSTTSNEEQPKQPVKLIIDLDMDSDCDDMGALAMAHALADRGECDILAVMTCTCNEWTASCADAVNTYYGRPDLPIGQLAQGVYQKSRYTRYIAENFPNDVMRDCAPEATGLYRALLSKADDQSIVVVTLGNLTNLQNLLQSEADTHSPLNGPDLVQQKVKHLICMGSRYPADTAKPAFWGNFRTDPAAAIIVARDWPTLIHFTGGGDFAWACASGDRFDEVPATNPVRKAYELFLQRHEGTPGRKKLHSADQISIWVAVRGIAPYFTTVTEGHNVIDEHGRNVWHSSPNDPRHQYTSDFADGVDPHEVAAAFNELMIQPPRHPGPETMQSIVRETGIQARDCEGEESRTKRRVLTP